MKPNEAQKSARRRVPKKGDTQSLSSLLPVPPLVTSTPPVSSSWSSSVSSSVLLPNSSSWQPLPASTPPIQTNWNDWNGSVLSSIPMPHSSSWQSPITPAPQMQSSWSGSFQLSTPIPHGFSGAPPFTPSAPMHNAQLSHPPHWQNPVTVPPVQWHAGMSPHPYTFARKCYGCGQDFAQKYRDCPTNLVVKHVDKCIRGRDEQSGSLVYSPDFTNSYYHPICSHIRRKNPLFAGTVNIDHAMYDALTVGQKQVLSSFDVSVQVV